MTPENDAYQQCANCGERIEWEMAFAGPNKGEWAWRHINGTPTRYGNLPERCYGYPSEEMAVPA